MYALNDNLLKGNADCLSKMRIRFSTARSNSYNSDTANRKLSEF